MGWDEINKSRDYTANVKTASEAGLAGKAPTAHTHVGADITDATTGATPNTIMKRTSAGNVAVADPTHATHAATKAYVDANGGSAQANGPTSTAYNRALTGSSYYQVWMNSALQFMRNTSSRRYKKRIRKMEPVLEKVLQLRPVRYELKEKSAPGERIGLIAEDVVELFPEVITFDEQGRPDAVDYQSLVAPVIRAMQEQQVLIVALEARLKALEER
jgi:hypothetical protein